MITPVPIFVPMEDERCPNCDREENIIEVCGHCGHKYEEEEFEGSVFGVVAKILLVVIVFCWLLITLTIWVFSNEPLLDILISQWDAITSLRLW